MLDGIWVGLFIINKSAYSDASLLPVNVPGIGAHQISLKKYEKGKGKRGKMLKKKNEKGRKREKGKKMRKGEEKV
jgi:hypothetical protein